MITPFTPMSPILQHRLPIGDEWLYQLKWDGVRIIAEVHAGKVHLYSKNMQLKNDTFPELMDYLRAFKNNFVLDGEVVVIDENKGRPDFHSVLKRLRQKNRISIERSKHILPITYAVFDLLYYNDKDLRALPFIERFTRLQQLIPEQKNHLLISDVFSEGTALWSWVNQNDWEGVVSKKRNSAYKEGKKHSDWIKTKKVRTFEVLIPAYTLNEGRLASLIMTIHDTYCGKVSAGLSQAYRQQILDMCIVKGETSPSLQLPTEIKKSAVRWLLHPLTAVVTSLEMTDSGVLRQPKIIELWGVTG